MSIFILACWNTVNLTLYFHIMHTGKLACPYHVDDMCSCPHLKKVLKFRYTMDELRDMLAAITRRAEGYKNWSDRVEGVLDGLVPQKAGG